MTDAVGTPLVGCTLAGVNCCAGDWSYLTDDYCGWILAAWKIMSKSVFEMLLKRLLVTLSNRPRQNNLVGMTVMQRRESLPSWRARAHDLMPTGLGAEMVAPGFIDGS